MSETAEPQKDPKDVTDTMQAHWRTYRDKAFPPEIPANANRELHRAFMAGAFVMFIKMNVIADRLGEDEACARLDALNQELRQLLQP